MSPLLLPVLDALAERTGSGSLEPVKRKLWRGSWWAGLTQLACLLSLAGVGFLVTAVYLALEGELGPPGAAVITGLGLLGVAMGGFRSVRSRAGL